MNKTLSQTATTTGTRCLLVQWGEFGRMWRSLIPDIEPRIYPYLSAIFSGEIHIDLDHLGRALQLRYPEEWKESSMEDILTRHYGKEACEFIRMYL